MLVKHLHHLFIPLFIPSAARAPRRQVVFWFCLSMTFAVVYASLGLQEAFSSPYIVQDDARQHVFWMQRFADPELFPNDLIADYFQSVAPWGYTTLYQLAAAIGIPPFLFNKLLPLLLGLVMTGFGFGVCWLLLPVPFAGFVGSLLLNQNVWAQDDLISGTARAFVYPIFLAFLYYLLRRDATPFVWKSLVPCLVTIVLEGIFYPQFVFIMAGTLVLRLVVWRRGLRLSRDRRDYITVIAGLATAFAVMLPYALEVSDYSPLITVEQAKTMLEFAKDGRSNYFDANPVKFWLWGKRSGAFLWVMPFGIISPILILVVAYWRQRSPEPASHPLPLARRVQNLSIFWQVALASIAMFLAAHALLFRLYLPARYMHTSLLVLTALAAAIGVTVLLDGLLRWAEQRTPRAKQRQTVAIAITVVIIGLLIVSPTFYEFPKTQYKQARFPALYTYLAQQPKDTLIAALGEEADYIPTFAQRSVLVGREYSVPYQMGYYEPLRQRIMDLMWAQYSPNLGAVKRFIRTYGVDLWLIERPYLRRLTPEPPNGNRLTNTWLQQFQPLATRIERQLQRGKTPAIATLVNRCTAFKNRRLVVLDAACILEAPDRP